jgi:hypothetical protein
MSLLAQKINMPIIKDNVVFEEKNGLVAVEAEFFYKQSNSYVRQWYITSKGNLPDSAPNPDEAHVSGSSNNAYVEVLPDTRVTDKDELIPGENFSNEPGKLAVIHYKVKINATGRYYVWVRCYSSGAEDNGLHVGFNGTWPDHGQRMQWCDGKNKWTWAGSQRTETVHCGVPKEIYLDIDKAGIYDIQFSMREDGFEFDKFLLTKDINYIPKVEGPNVKKSKGRLPATFPKVEAGKTSAT